ncbi:MAG: Holliday junction branch migration protein RuvA [Deltaproteobacteria bacterium]|nr:Holliday junction branch migration protein RuvA [Deltaproteobacteria bacterium]MDQ3296378.1 Holliday junction branch migration protein RuvA [Myxococcota bacterium]
MIARLEGTLVRDGDQVIVDCNGVGYEVTCSQYTLGSLPAHGDRVVLRVFTQVRETEIALFGFIDPQERGLFDLLITVKNVGPSTAITMLSGSTPRDIAALIAREDVAGLTRIKGIGKKTAELLVVELREKCELLVLSWTADGGIRTVASSAGAVRSSKSARHPMLGEVMSALVGMGWRPIEAEAAVGELAVDDGASIETLLRQALRSMPR